MKKYQVELWFGADGQRQQFDETQIHQAESADALRSVMLTQADIKLVKSSGTAMPAILVVAREVPAVRIPCT